MDSALTAQIDRDVTNLAQDAIADLLIRYYELGFEHGMAFKSKAFMELVTAAHAEVVKMSAGDDKV